jgi:hypothetical protein
MATIQQIRSMGFSATRVTADGPGSCFVGFHDVVEARGFADAARSLGHEAYVYNYRHSAAVRTTL